MKAMILCQNSTDDFLEKIESGPPLVSKDDVDQFLSKDLQFDSVEELKIWELTASNKEKEERQKGLENLFNLLQRRFWLLEIMQPN